MSTPEFSVLVFTMSASIVYFNFSVYEKAALFVKNGHIFMCAFALELNSIAS